MKFIRSAAKRRVPRDIARARGGKQAFAVHQIGSENVEDLLLDGQRFSRGWPGVKHFGAGDPEAPGPHRELRRFVWGVLVELVMVKIRVNSPHILF